MSTSWDNIKNAIPNILTITDANVMRTINKIIEIVTLVLSIVTIDQLSHKNMIDPRTNEGIIFIVFICLIGYCAISLGMPQISNYPILNVIDGFLYIIVIIYSIILLFLQGIFGILSGIVSDIMTNPIDVLMKYAGLYAVIAVAIWILYAASFDATSLTSKSYVYAFSIIVPLILIIGYVYPFTAAQNNPLYNTVIMGLIFIFFTSMFYYFASTSLQTFTTISYFINFIIVLIVLVGLAVLFYVCSNFLKHLEGWPGFITYFIFYIPCLVIDFVKYIKNEFAITSNVVYILFIVEVLLILLYIYLPKLVEYISYTDGVVLLNESIFLDNQQVIGNNKPFIMPPLDENAANKDQVVYRKNYGLSMWIYLNTAAMNNSAYSKETTIFDYGGGKPKITYFNNTATDSGKDKYIIYFTNKKTGEMSYEITLPSQKWNYFAFNFSTTTADLFINGKLEKTFTYIGNRPTYAPTDAITVGSPQGLNGAICNIRYYAVPLSSSQIANSYNLLMYKNPPTINV